MARDAILEAVTPALTLLERVGVAHRVLTYDHDPGAQAYGTEAAEVLNLAADTVFKTLVAVIDGATHVVGVVPVSGRLDLKALARAAGDKKAIMADNAAAERLTGYAVGGISPLGQKKPLPTFIDTSAQGATVIYVSGGRRGLEIELRPGDLLAATKGSYASIGANGNNRT